MHRLYLTGRRLRAFAGDTRAVAAVEFALVLPLMLALYLGSVEAARLFTADRKVATIAGTMGDLVSRQRDKIARSALDDYFAAAQNIMQPLTTAGLAQVVSMVEIDDEGKAWVRWSRASGAGAVRELDSPFPLDGTTSISQLARNASGWLVASEVSYPYEPIVGYIIADTVNLRHVEYFLPRFEDEIELDEDN